MVACGLERDAVRVVSEPTTPDYGVRYEPEGREPFTAWGYPNEAGARHIVAEIPQAVAVMVRDVGPAREVET